MHIVVGLWPMALIFDLFSRTAAQNNPLVRLSFYSIGLGLVAVLPAVVTGVLDWSEIKKEKPAWKLGLYHMLLNLAVFGLFAGNFALRLKDWSHATSTRDLPLVLSLTGTALLCFSAWLGGRMVYHYGIGVGRKSKKKWRGIAEAGGANVPEQNKKGAQ